MKSFNYSIKSKWKRRDIILLLERLEMYVSAGLTIDKAIKTAAEGTTKWQNKSLNVVREAVESGGAFSKAIKAQINIPETISGILEHGQSSGELSKALSQSRLLLEREEELLKKCTGAMVYPVVIGLFATLLTLGLVKGVMPQIIPMLKSLRVELPLITRLTIAFSEAVTDYGLYILIALIFGVPSLLICYRKFPKLKRLIHRLIMLIPLIGKLVKNYSLCVFLRSCGSLVESGISVEEAYSKTARTISLLPLRDSLISQSSAVGRGLSLGSVLSRQKIPPYIAPLVSAGEASGTLGSSILRASGIIDRDIEHSLKKITSLIEPVMMAAMGGVVGAIALSIMMPIYDVSKALQN